MLQPGLSKIPATLSSSVLSLTFVEIPITSKHFPLKYCIHDPGRSKNPRKIKVTDLLATVSPKAPPPPPPPPLHGGG